MTATDRLLRLIPLGGTAVTLITMASLHLLQPDLNPFSQPMSYYGPGAYGFVFTTSIAAFGVALLALAALLHSQQQSPVTWSFVMVAAVSAMIVAMFNADLPDAPHTLHGILHGLGALFFWTAFPVAAIDLSSGLRQRTATRGLGRVSLTLGVLSLIHLSLSLAITPLGGFFERTLLITDAAWLVLVALSVGRD